VIEQKKHRFKRRAHHHAAGEVMPVVGAARSLTAIPVGELDELFNSLPGDKELHALERFYPKQGDGLVRVALERHDAKDPDEPSRREHELESPGFTLS
jgi:hypothetical protein